MNDIQDRLKIAADGGRAAPAKCRVEEQVCDLRYVADLLGFEKAAEALQTIIDWYDRKQGPHGV